MASPHPSPDTGTAPLRSAVESLSRQLRELTELLESGATNHELAIWARHELAAAPSREQAATNTELAINEALAGFDRALDQLPAAETVWRGRLLRVRAALAREAGLSPLAPVQSLQRDD